VVNFETFDNVSAIKATIKRKVSSGSPGDTDCYGMNQEAPLLQLSFPEEVFAAKKSGISGSFSGTI